MIDREHQLRAAALDALRPGSPADAIDGVTAEWVAEPPTPEGVAAVLAWCAAHREAVVIRGGGTHLAWGRKPSKVAVVLSTRGLQRVLRYEPGDLTVTVEAGLAIRALNLELAARGQWLPLDADSDASTVGGALATNVSGPLRHRYGTPRDQVIGVRLATADGRLASAGGQVVKNVAGYDLSKLITGSFGSLGAIVGATFKLAPIPAATMTLAAEFRDSASLAAAANAVSASQLDPLCLEAEATVGPHATHRLLVRFGGTAASTREQVLEAATLVASRDVLRHEVLEPDADRALWSNRAANVMSDDAIRVRASWMPAQLAAVIGLVERLHRDLGVDITCQARAAVGAGTLDIRGELEAAASVVQRLREQTDLVHHVVIVTSPTPFKEQTDVWGPPPPAAVMSLALKGALDPAGVLNASRGPF